MTERAKKAIEWVDEHVAERHMETARADPWPAWTRAELIAHNQFHDEREGEPLAEPPTYSPDTGD